jgi:hypothetical protein
MSGLEPVQLAILGGLTIGSIAQATAFCRSGAFLDLKVTIS